VAAVENLYARYNSIDQPDQIPALSEQQLVDCNMIPNLGCIGGKQIFAFNYTKNEGLTSSEGYEYEDKTGACRYQTSPQTQTVFKIDGFKAYNHL